MGNSLCVVVDTREQLPYRFDGSGVDLERGKLDQGDYSVRGLSDRCAIERKTLEDFIGCCGRERARFKRELGRLASLDCAAVVIEAGYYEVLCRRYRSRISPDSVLGSVASWSAFYRIPFFWAGDRAGGEDLTLRLLKQYRRHLTAGSGPSFHCLAADSLN